MKNSGQINIHKARAMGRNPSVKSPVKELVKITSGAHKMENHEKGAPVFERKSGGGWSPCKYHTVPTK